MKKGIFMIASFLLITISACADNDTISRNPSDLPVQSRTFLTEHFGNMPVAHIKIEKNWLGVKGYDVILTDGTKVEFTKDGEWKEVKGHRQGIPSAIIPASILRYLRQHYDGIAVTAIDKDSRDYELDLKNGVELTFDRQGNFLTLDY